jgi:uncharacterized protein
VPAVLPHPEHPGRAEAAAQRHRSANIARRLLRAVRMVRVDEPLLDRAADLEPGELRTIDAINLASALEIGQDLGVMIAYEIRLKAAAQAYGPAVESPS